MTDKTPDNPKRIRNMRTSYHAHTKSEYSSVDRLALAGAVTRFNRDMEGAGISSESVPSSSLNISQHHRATSAKTKHMTFQVHIDVFMNRLFCPSVALSSLEHNREVNIFKDF